MHPWIVVISSNYLHHRGTIGFQCFRSQRLHQSVRPAQQQHDGVATFQFGVAAHVFHRVHVLRDQQHVPQMDRDFSHSNRGGVLRVRLGSGKKKPDDQL